MSVFQSVFLHSSGMENAFLNSVYTKNSFISPFLNFNNEGNNLCESEWPLNQTTSGLFNLSSVGLIISFNSLTIRLSIMGFMGISTLTKYHYIEIPVFDISQTPIRIYNNKLGRFICSLSFLYLSRCQHYNVSLKIQNLLKNPLEFSKASKEVKLSAIVYKNSTGSRRKVFWVRFGIVNVKRLIEELFV